MYSAAVDVFHPPTANAIDFLVSKPAPVALS